jgi:hypothetical protein
MKLIKFFIGLFCSILVGFLFAGLFGAIGMGLILALTICIFKSKFQISDILLKTFVFSVLAYVLMLSVGLLNANDLVHKKVDLIKDELINMGYRPKWVIISQKRNEFYNNMLTNSKKNGKSKHLVGKAIDLYIYDINGDGSYNIKDFEIFKMASRKVEIINPEIKGGLNNYLNKGLFSRRMIHVEVSN